MKTQSVAARELYAIWRQSIDNNDRLKETIHKLVSFLVRITDPKQVRGAEIQGVLKEILEIIKILKIIKSVDDMCTETGAGLQDCNGSNPGLNCSPLPLLRT